MSADNTIVVFMTRRRDGRRGSEFRVANVQAVERILEEADYPSVTNPELNREELCRCFADSYVFFEMEEAFDAALEIEKQYCIVEYGIKFLDYRYLFFPASGKRR